MTFDKEVDAALIADRNNSNNAVIPAKRDIQSEGDAQKRTKFKKPDGGFNAYLVMLCGFLCNGILFGIINTYSVIYLSIYNELTKQGDELASSKAALIGSLTIGATFFLSPISGILIDQLGFRGTTIFGAIFTSTGMFLSSYFVEDPLKSENVPILCITYGLMFGTGAALAYTPSLAILAHYFDKKHGLASGFVAAGSSVFTFLLPPILKYINDNHGLKGCLFTQGSMSLFIFLFAFVFKPLHESESSYAAKDNQSLLRKVINFDNWKKKKYIVWVIAIPIALFGYFVPYVHIGKFIEENFPQENKNLPLMCIGVTSGIGRIFFGWLADRKGVNRILLQQISFFIIGSMTISLPFTTNFYLLMLFIVGLGLFDGCFISLFSPIANDLCGVQGSSQAIGFLFGLSSIGLTLGPALAGEIYDQTKSYTMSFVLFSIPTLVGGSVMSFIHCIKERRHDENVVDMEVPLPPRGAWIDEKEPMNRDENRTISD